MRNVIVPVLAPVLALAAASVALPAAAQAYHGPARHGPAHHAPAYGNWQSINARQASLDRRIDQGVRKAS